MKVENRQAKISKREAVSGTRRLASMFARFSDPRMITSKLSVVAPQEILEEMTKALNICINSKHKKDCLQALNEDIEKKYKGASRILYG